MNVLLTGGTRGLGLELVQQQVAAGHRLFVVGRSLSTELSELICQHPQNIDYIECDLSETQNIKSTVFDRHFGTNIPLHGFVNNAALAYDDLVTNLNMDQLQQMFQVNVFAAMLLTKYVIRNMLLHSVEGSLVHISSVSAHSGFKGLAMYAATKGAIEAFSINTAREWGVKRIRSNCVVAGFMETSMTASLSASQKERIYQRSALRQATQPSSVAETVGFLLSGCSQSITGKNIIVDAGTV